MATEEYQEPIPTVYDNDVTLLYKWAGYWNVPVRLVVVRPRQPGEEDLPGTAELVFDPLSSWIDRLLQGGASLSDIYDQVKTASPSTTADDIVMSYYSIYAEGATQDLRDRVNAFYREIDETGPPQRFVTDRDLQIHSGAWSEAMRLERSKDLAYLDTIYGVQDQLDEISTTYDPIEVSPTIIRRVTLAYHPTLLSEARPVGRDDGYEIFEASVLSDYVPFVQYNAEVGSHYYKVYTGSYNEERPNYSLTVMPSTRTSSPNALYLTLWLGDPDRGEKIQSAPKDSFFLVVYYLDNNYLTIESPLGERMNEEEARRRVQLSLPSLDLGPGREIKIRGEFQMWNFEYDDTTLLHDILIEPLFNVYLYVEESIKPYALKKRLDVHFRSLLQDEGEGNTPTGEAYISNSAAASVALKQQYSKEEMAIEVITDKGVDSRVVPVGTPYVSLKITKAKSRQAAKEFTMIWQLLMRFYRTDRERVYQVYRSLVPELDLLPELREQRRAQEAPPIAEGDVLRPLKKKRGLRQEESNIRKLQAAAPDLFIEGYARKCQKQPVLIAPEEVEVVNRRGRTEYRTKALYPYKGRMVPRNVMLFPKENGMYYFCPSEENPHPGAKVNTLPNKDIYSHFPCCYKTDRLLVGEGRGYEAYLRGEVPQEKTTGCANEKPSTDKILTPHCVAYLPLAVERLLKQYSSRYIDMVRYGVPHTPNSLLHCVCVAVDDTAYYRRKTVEEKESYVRQLRRLMVERLHPYVYMQELYDHDVPTIERELLTEDLFLDPLLYYRGVEELFHINLYIFAVSGERGEEDHGAMEIPRSKLFHAHTPRYDRPTVLVIRHYGSESDALTYPQCELIVDFDMPLSQAVKLFGERMTTLCQQALSQTARVITWKEAQARVGIEPGNPNIVARDNLYYAVDYLALFPYPATSQYIDGNGKMRALTFQVRADVALTVAIPPSQPEDLPFSDQMARPPLALVLQILGEPSAVSLNGEEQADGLWFPLFDIPEGVYVPIAISAPPPGLRRGPSNPLFAPDYSATGRVRLMRRTIDLLMQVLYWLFELGKLTRLITPEMFATLYLVYDDRPDGDSAYYYDFARLPRRLPRVGSPEEGIAALQPLVPTLFRSGRAVMYSPTFAAKVIDGIDNYYRSTYGLPPDPPRLLSRYYRTESDFAYQERVIVFTEEKDLASWLSGATVPPERLYSIRTRVDPTLSSTVDPLLFQQEGGRIYLIQNVVAGDKQRAISVAYTWYSDRVNLGFNAEPQQVEEVELLVYTIGPNGGINLTEDPHSNLPVRLRLLYYAGEILGGKYAALLPLL